MASNFNVEADLILRKLGELPLLLSVVIGALKWCSFENTYESLQNNMYRKGKRSTPRCNLKPERSSSEEQAYFVHRREQSTVNREQRTNKNEFSRVRFPIRCPIFFFFFLFSSSRFALFFVLS